MANRCRAVYGSAMRAPRAIRLATLTVVVALVPSGAFGGTVATVAQPSPRTGAVQVAVSSRDNRANVWVHALRRGSCTRAATPAAYNAATACPSFAAAYAAANASARASVVRVRGGTYTNVRITGNRTSRNRITFAPAVGETVTFTGSQFNIGDGTARTAPKHVTVTGMVGAEFGPGSTCPDCRYGVFVDVGSSHIELRNLTVGSVAVHGSTDILVRNSALGPCRARTASHTSLTQIKSGCSNNEFSHHGAQPKRITFDNVVIHNYDFSASCFSVANGGTNTAGQPGCHWEPMFVIGVDGFTLRNSIVRESFMGIVFAVAGDAAATGNKNILIENNFFGTGVNYPGGYKGRAYGRWESAEFSHCYVARAGVYAFDNVIYRFNSGSSQAGFIMDLSDPRCAGKIRKVRVIGNIGLRNRCTTGVTYRYNIYSNAGRCHSTDRSIRASGAIPFYLRRTHSPRPRDYRLIRGRTLADNRVPARIGCPARDKFGNRRGVGGFCDAGAHER